MMKPRSYLVRCVLITGAFAMCSLPATGASDEAVREPEVSLSLRGLVDDALEQGEPLCVAVGLEASKEGAGSIELAPVAGTWVDAVAVELSAAGSSTVIARATPVGAPESPRARLDGDHVAGGLWTFSTDVTRGLAVGDYVVRARLSVAGHGGWSGAISSDEVPLTVIALSAVPERVSARTRVRAELALSRNAPEEAARLLDAVLANTPDEFELLCLRTEVALRGGNPVAAMICANRAERFLSAKAMGPPPLILADVRSRVLAAMTDPASLADPPKWTWLPASVLKMPEAELPVPSQRLSPPLASTPPASVSTTSPVAAAPASSAPAPLPVAPTASTPNATSIGTVVPSSELAEAKILADSAGQWAATARAGSEYGKTQYSAARATGAPNVPVVGNSPDAWCPVNKSSGTDWLELTFTNPVPAVEVRVRQSDAAGAIAKVEAIEPDGTAHIWWEGADPYQAPAVRDVAWFGVRVPRTTYSVAKIKLTLNLASGPGWKQIDAVQLVAATGP